MEPARVLLVDDHEDTRDGFESYLNWFGLATATASNGNEALVRLRDMPTDVVVMDMGLPGMSGWDTVRAIRREPAIARVPVIAFTGYASESDIRMAFQVGCNAFLAKPATPGALMSEVNCTLIRSWARLARAESGDRRAERVRLVARTSELLIAIKANANELVKRRHELGEALAQLKSLRPRPGA